MVVKRWMTHPEVVLVSPGEFETCPDWVPVMDTGKQLARIAPKTISGHGFDYRANRVAKVRNVSTPGSQNRQCDRARFRRPLPIAPDVEAPVPAHIPGPPTILNSEEALESGSTHIVGAAMPLTDLKNTIP